MKNKINLIIAIISMAICWTMYSFEHEYTLRNNIQTETTAEKAVGFVSHETVQILKNIQGFVNNIIGSQTEEVPNPETEIAPVEEMETEDISETVEESEIDSDENPEAEEPETVEEPEIAEVPEFEATTEEYEEYEEFIEDNAYYGEIPGFIPNIKIEETEGIIQPIVSEDDKLVFPEQSEEYSLEGT